MRNTKSKFSWKTFIKKISFLYLFSMLVYLILDTSVRSFNIFHTFKYLTNHKKNFVLSTSILTGFLVFVLAIFNQIIPVLFVVLYGVVILAIANYLKIQWRGEPIVPSDLAMVKSFSDLFQMVEWYYFALFIIATILLVYGVIKLRKKYHYTLFGQHRFGKRVRAAGLIVSFMFLSNVHNIHAEGNMIRELRTKVGFRYYKGSTLLSYQTNSFVLGFVDNFTGQAMEKPPVYSQKRVQQVLAPYHQEAQKRNAHRKRDDFEDVSVIFVLSESLADPRVIEGVHLDKNPIEYIQNPVDKYAVGKLIVPVYGGGTPNSEFELLTSLSIQNLQQNMNIPYQRFIPRYNWFPSFVSEYKQGKNNKAIAIHSFNSKLYKRRDVFRILGFDEMYFDSDMKHTEKLDKSNYISDESAYREVLDHLVSRPDENLFIHLMTMQNHSGYSDKYHTYHFEPKTENGEDLDQVLQYYVEGIYRTDIVTKEFISALDKLDRKVMVVFYGDHHPGLYSSLMDQNDAVRLHLTDFFVYSNFTDDRIEVDHPISTTNLLNYVYDAADVKVNAYQQLIYELRQKVVADIEGEYLLDTGERVSYEELSPEYKRLVDDYYLIQYDIIEGDMYTMNFLYENR